MNIQEDIYKAHQYLSSANVTFIDFIKRHPEGFDLSSFNVED
jgi:hypothetical protein